MNIEEIVQKFIVENGFDGLFNGCTECACLREDLMPCGEPGIDCEPGYMVPDFTGEGDWRIVGDRSQRFKAIVSESRCSTGGNRRES